MEGHHTTHASLPIPGAGSFDYEGADPLPRSGGGLAEEEERTRF